jgi:hypothetical protein
MRRPVFALSYVIWVIPGVFLAALVFGVCPAAPAEAVTFQPSTRICLDDSATFDTMLFLPGGEGECDGDHAPGAASGVTFEFGLTAPHSLPEETIYFVPPGWAIPPDADVPDGNVAGNVRVQLNLGFGGNGCDDATFLSFLLREATTDQSDLVNFDQQDNPAGPVLRGVVEYPDYLLGVWASSRGDTATALQPVTRYFGELSFSVPFQLSLNVAVFSPGITYRGIALDPGLGHPVVITPQISGHWDEYPTPRPTSVDCSPADVAMSINNGVWTNPDGAGAYAFTTYALSQRDADGDGHENGLDTCPLVPNPAWDPREPLGGDGDGDVVPDECDPLPADAIHPGGGGLDHDSDYYDNHQDNCVFLKNNLGLPLFGSGGPDNQGDADFDDIGDACDPNPTSPDGGATAVCKASVVVVGALGAPAFDPSGAAPCSSAQMSVGCPDDCGDADGDGVIDVFDNCPDTANPGQEDATGDGEGDACEPVGGSVTIAARQAAGDGHVAAAVMVIAAAAVFVLAPVARRRASARAGSTGRASPLRSYRTTRGCGAPHHTATRPSA